MQLLLELRADRHPSRKKVKKLYRLVGEMGLKETNFRELQVRLIYPDKDFRGRPGYPSEKIIFQGQYREIYCDDSPANVCTFSLILQRIDGELFGSFHITDPLWPDRFIARTQDLPITELLKILDKGQDIGSLPRETRAQWFKYEGWKSLLEEMQHI
jgi:hypothetical protein